MRKKSFTAFLAAALFFALSTPSSSEAYVVFDPTNFTANMGNYVTQVTSWTSSLAHELQGLQQFGTQIQQYATMLSYVGNPQALANAVGLGPVMRLGTQAQTLYGQFSNIQNLQGLTSATGALANTMNGLYPAINPSNILNSQAFQKYQLLTNAGQQFQKVLDWNKQQQQTLAGAMNSAVSDLQNAPNETAQLRAIGSIAAIQAAQQQAQAATKDAVDTALVTQIEEEAMNEQANDAAYQEAAKNYVAGENAYQTSIEQSLQKLGTPPVNIPTPSTPVQNSGAKYNPVGIQPSTGGL